MTRLFRITFLLTPILIVAGWIILAVSPDPALKEFQSRPYSLTITDRSGAPLQTLPLADGLWRERAGLDQLPALGRTSKHCLRELSWRALINGFLICFKRTKLYIIPDPSFINLPEER